MIKTDTQAARPVNGSRTRYACWQCEDTQVVYIDKDNSKPAMTSSKHIVADWCPRCVK